MDGQDSGWPDAEIKDENDAFCSTLIKSKLGDWLVIVSVILLVVINAMVIFGNILVILSVFVSQKLRTSTNFFIVSLGMFSTTFPDVLAVSSVLLSPSRLLTATPLSACPPGLTTIECSCR